MKLLAGAALKWRLIKLHNRNAITTRSPFGEWVFNPVLHQGQRYFYPSYQGRIWKHYSYFNKRIFSWWSASCVWCKSILCVTPNVSAADCHARIWLRWREIASRHCSSLSISATNRVSIAWCCANAVFNTCIWRLQFRCRLTLFSKIFCALLSFMRIINIRC